MSSVAKFENLKDLIVELRGQRDFLRTQQSLRLSQKSDSYQEAFRSCRLLNVKDKADQKALMQRSGELIAGLFDDDLQTSDTETSIELNFAVLKFTHTIRKKKK